MRKNTLMKKSKMNIQIGISEKDRKEISACLSKLLADTFVLYLKTHNFHWNVTGPQFHTLHVMFMEQYTEQWNALDTIAERIRALGYPAPGTFKEYGKLASIKEESGVPNSDEMIRQLVEGNEAVAKTAREAFRAASSADDEPTAGLCADRMEIHEKTAWMLRSLIP